MVWDYEECYIKYLQASDYLKGLLGISQLDIDLDRKVLLPYQTQIIDYLNTRLIKLGTDDIKAKIEDIFDAFSWGADLICSEAALELARQVGIGIEDNLYDQDRFVFSWADLMSTLRLRLKLQYSYLFADEIGDDDCCSCCGKGQTVEDFESWNSGVYPEDEVYNRANIGRVNTNWTVAKNDGYCECQRRNSQSSNGSNGNE